MLRVFRENLKNLSWVLWLVIAVFILLVFVDFGGTVPGGTGRPSDVAATVGSDKISFGEFQRAYQQAESAYRQAYGDQFSGELARQIGLPGQVLESLVAQRILRREARAMGLEVTDAELQRAILEFPAFQSSAGGFVGPDVYARTLRNAGYTVEEFEESMRNDLLNEKLRALMARSVYVTDAEVEEAYREQVERARVRLVKLSTEPGDEAGEPPSDQELAAFFEEHRDDYNLPERRTLDYLLVDRAALQATLQVTDEEVETYYRENPAEFETEEQVRARHILLRVNDQRTREQAAAALEAARARVEAGEAFAAVASELSEDPGSKTRGGDLGFFGRGRMVPAFEEAAFGASAGEIVGPVVTSFGAHLIQVEERRDAGTEPLGEVRERIRARLLSAKAVTTAEAKAQELAQRIDSEGITGSGELAALAEGDPAVTFSSIEGLAEGDAVPGIGRDTVFTVAAFDLEPGAVSDPVKIARGWALLHLVEVQEPRPAELADVREEVVGDLQRQRRREQAVARLGGAASRIEAGESLDDVAARLGVEVEEPGEFGRGAAVGSLGRQPRIVAAALASEVGEVAGPFEIDGAVVLIQIADRVRFDPARYAEERQATRERLESERSETLLAEVVRSRREKLEVRYAPELVENFDLAVEEPAGT
ncbi:MAG: SurA N-terminal domain-containing protein [Thermoanaerobaculia bacterium]|nr:SurA N-terminal domain-containing protein [Thermoanaerobaculia bacterium]